MYRPGYPDPLTLRDALRLAQMWCDSDHTKRRAGEWGITLASELAGDHEAIIARILRAFPWMALSSVEPDWPHALFDGEVSSSLGPLQLREIASISFFDNPTFDKIPWVNFSVYPNAFITKVELHEGHELVYGEEATRKNRERLHRSLVALEPLLGGPIVDGCSEQFEAIELYGIPEGAVSFWGSE
ncbi:hypothetical protein FRC96_12220 [Lujinxingia vulgaris]|uniref:Uncharacterized protein n=1 Tax=Lujinxingia vulgaris TaxID=2600176 RepID=A0A5C6X142_9DELT|nr:hypothetical protein [Lujinxingia vulgaris]TXD34818.1 hypothetical protein FRC96_12220 [Lujinxingia vulgaris]